MLIDASQKPDDLDRELDLPLSWELSQEQAETLARQRTAERNRAGQERMMRLMQTGKGR